jgi:4a-hydroxytetrahydrobiopterin dehydratase
MIMALAEQRCEGCEGGVAPLSEDEARAMGAETPQWQIQGDRIERTFRFADFVEAMRFANGVAEIAEQEKHHPDLHVSWGKVRIELSTHAIHGLSKNDFIMAAKIDKL